MRIVQVHNSLTFGDAIGNTLRTINDIILRMGYETEIVASKCDSRIHVDNIRVVGDDVPEFKADDILILHMCSFAQINEYVYNSPNRKFMIYHNITPPEFFDGFAPGSANSCRKGLEQVRRISGCFERIIADSEYNKSDLIEYGVPAEKIDVIPIVVPFNDYRQKPDFNYVSQFMDGKTNILFVGRIAPNKKQEDIIRQFAHYKKHVNADSRLIFVGRDDSASSYMKSLKDYIKALDVKDVVFPGHVSFRQILAFYKIADVFLCMSEHEGFCVPLVEAMFMQTPIIAYASTAVPETMGGSGIVIDDKNPAYVAAVIDEVVSNAVLRKELINSQNTRLKDFEYGVIAAKWIEFVWNLMES
ncbi:MAG: glycosyltransferase family 4 protein [Ruminiclostridium sp.]|nr:glycosyltransferase family 4 protein [Ruminiclostridium sp.]